MVKPGHDRVFGGARRRDRVDDTYQWLESRFNRATRGSSPLGPSANRVARRLTHAVLGAAPIRSYDVVLEGTAEALRRLAHDEQVRVVPVQGFIRLPSGSGSKARPRTSLVRAIWTKRGRSLSGCMLRIWTCRRVRSKRAMPSFSRTARTSRPPHIGHRRSDPKRVQRRTDIRPFRLTDAVPSAFRARA